MIRGIALTALLALSAGAMGNSANNISNADADGTVLMQSYQNNSIIDGTLPYATFSKDRVTCPTSKFSAGLIPTFTENDYGDHYSNDFGDSKTYVAMVSFNMPLDLDGSVSRCKKQQESLIKAAEIQNDLVILSACKQAAMEGLHLDPLVFKWAHKCPAVIKVHKPYERKPRDHKPLITEQNLGK